MTTIDSKTYHRQPGEPNRWFQRFEHFKDLGPDRSLARCYREVINRQRVRDGRPPLSTNASCPAVWRQRAIRILESAMLSELKNPDGTLTPGQNCTQRRLAAEKILDLVGVGVVDLDDTDDHQPEIKGLMIHDCRSPEGIAYAEQCRREADARYNARRNAGHDHNSGKPAED